LNNKEVKMLVCKNCGVEIYYDNNYIKEHNNKKFVTCVICKTDNEIKKATTNEHM
jgi:hypothetical protein